MVDINVLGGGVVLLVCFVVHLLLFLSSSWWGSSSWGLVLCHSQREGLDWCASPGGSMGEWCAVVCWVPVVLHAQYCGIWLGRVHAGGLGQCGRRWVGVGGSCQLCFSLSLLPPRAALACTVCAWGPPGGPDACLLHLSLWSWCAAHPVWLGHTVPLGWCVGTLFVLVGVLPRVFFLSCDSYGAMGSCYWLFVLYGWIHNELSGFN